MMKKQRKKSSKAAEKKSVQSADFSNLGIEPPKIYRESQYNNLGSGKSTRAVKSDRLEKQNLSRSEKRQIDNKKRKKKNIFRKILIWFSAMIAFVSVGVVLSLTVFFQISDITVLGNERYSAEEILAHCTVNEGENLFLADTNTSKELLEKNLPYIYDAQLKRKLPGIIEINIKETKSEYSIRNQDKTYILLDDNFKVLEDKAEKAEGIAISKAEIESAVPGDVIQFADKDTGECLAKLAQSIKINNFDQITSIYSNNISDNYVVYDKRIDFKLGTCDNLDNKIYQGMTACEKLNQSSPNAKGTMTVSGGKSIYFTEK